MFVVLQRILLELITFGFFYLFELLFFGIIGIVLFSDLQVFEDLSVSIFTLFQVTLGVYTIDVMDDARIGVFIA